jgi:hypothetical protein
MVPAIAPFWSIEAENVPLNKVVTVPIVIWPDQFPVAEPRKALTTVKIIAGLVIPSRFAVTLAIPGAAALTKPVPDIITPVLELSQVTFPVTSDVAPSGYLPEAVNCKVEPTIIFAGEDGVISIEASLEVVFDAQATMPTVKDAANNMVRK